MDPYDVLTQAFWLIILPIPVACVARTIASEEISREVRDYCKERVQHSRTLIGKKFFYLFTCDYCLSHWVALFFIWLTSFHLLLNDWRGYLISFFSTVFIANTYLGLYTEKKVEVAKTKKEMESS